MAKKNIWEQRIKGYQEGSPISLSLIRQLRKIFNQGGNYYVPRKSPYENYLIDYVLYPDMNKGWAIASDETLKGLKYLKRQKINVDNFDRFEFMGLLEIEESYCSVFFAVYRFYDKNGDWFDYASSPWQDGRMEFNILCESKK